MKFNIIYCFNSLMVRLKVPNRNFTDAKNTGFNSLMVRLKVTLVTVPVLLSAAFQFPNGSIKRRKEIEPCYVCDNVSIP